MNKNEFYRSIFRTILIFGLLFLSGIEFVNLAEADTGGPLKLHPDSPHWFVNPTGEAVFLSGSHTWANRQERGVEGETPEFDYDEYLDFMENYGHNFMRMWAWEHAQWMQFVSNEIPVRYRPLPYPRTGPGKARDGKLKFDLSKFNEDYFTGLRRRVEEADERGIYVGVMLFQGFSVSKTGGNAERGNAWHGHPFHPDNNINGINGNPNGDDTGHQVHTLDVPDVTRLQEAYIRKTIDTLNDLDNVLWEIGNENHRGSVNWQYHMIRYIKDYEADKPKQHLVGMTGSPIRNPALFDSPADWISPMGKEYLNDPPINEGDKAIIVDTDHIAPRGTDPRWVWRNFLRGNHFIVMDWYKDYRQDSPENPAPEWDEIRRAMGQAVRWSERVNLSRMKPDKIAASSGYCLNSDKEYLVYLSKGGEVLLDLTDNKHTFKVEWFTPKSDQTQHRGVIEGGVQRTFESPFPGESLLYLKAKTD